MHFIEEIFKGVYNAYKRLMSMKITSDQQNFSLTLLSLVITIRFRTFKIFNTLRTSLRSESLSIEKYVLTNTHLPPGMKSVGTKRVDIEPCLCYTGKIRNLYFARFLRLILSGKSYRIVLKKKKNIKKNLLC